MHIFTTHTSAYGACFASAWRDAKDRRFWWISVTCPQVGSPMVRCVMDDYGDLVAVGAVL